MTLSDELEELSKSVDAYARILGVCEQTTAGARAELTARKIRALAIKCAGKVLVKPDYYCGDDDMNIYASIPLKLCHVQGAALTDEGEDVAFANLQELLDKEGA